LKDVDEPEERRSKKRKQESGWKQGLAKQLLN
jgi:hypothetical protein